MMRKSKFSTLLLPFSVLIVFGLFFAIKISFQKSREIQVSDDTLELIMSISNEDVKWQGTVVGLIPELVGPSLALQDTPESINPLLIKLLLDRTKFVAAHVLLTRRTPGTFTETPGEWNNLKVQLFADGEVSYRGNNLLLLWMFWMRTLQP